MEHLTTQTVFLYLGSVDRKSSSSSTDSKQCNHILGAVSTHSIAKAYRMQTLHDRSLTPAKATLGLGILWTHPAARKMGIATTLVHAARDHAYFGMQVSKTMLAFSSPTQAGYQFAVRYLNGGEEEKGKQIAPLVYEM